MTRPTRWRVTAAFLLLSIAASRPASTSISEAIASAFKTDFAVPDAPAFLLLGVEPSIIVLPTTVKELAATVSDFASSGTFRCRAPSRSSSRRRFSSGARPSP